MECQYAAVDQAPDTSISCVGWEDPAGSHSFAIDRRSGGQGTIDSLVWQVSFF